MLKAYKYRLYPTYEQEILIGKSIGACRFVYNLALETKVYAFKAHGKTLSEYDLCYQLVDLKKDYAWLTEVDSQALKASIKNLDKAFNGFFRGGGFPKFKAKRIGGSFQCPNNDRRINWETSTLSVPKIRHIPIVLSRKFEGSIKTVTISKTPSGKYFASVLVEIDLKIPIPTRAIPESAVGIDLGIKDFVISSGGKKFEANRRLKNNLKRLKCIQRRVSRKKKGSNNRKKANKRLAILHEKITNQRTDYIHKVTTSLIKSDNQTFVIEDLNVAGMLKNRKLSQAISDVGWGEFRRQLDYKSRWYGKNLIMINRFEPTSKKCSCCEAINETLTLADREWICACCGVLHDRDINAAINIKNAGLKQYSGAGSSGESVESRRFRRAKKQKPIVPKQETGCQ